MIGIVIFVIIIVAVISAAKKAGNDKEPVNRNPNPKPPIYKASGQTAGRTAEDTAKMPQRSARSKNAGASHKSGGAYKQNEKKKQVTIDEIYDKNNIVAAAKANTLEVELDNDEDAKENLMEGVYEAMVKGPKDTISFQRDFLAEGIDMLNSFQAGNR